MGFVELDRWVGFAFSWSSRAALICSLTVLGGPSLFAYTASVTSLSEFDIGVFLLPTILPFILLMLARANAARARMQPQRLQEALGGILTGSYQTGLFPKARFANWWQNRPRNMHRELLCAGTFHPEKNQS